MDYEYEYDNDNDDRDDNDDDELSLRDDLPAVTVDAAITDFFLLERARASGARQRRLDRAIDDLRLCFEDVADRILTTPELATRDLERQFQPEGASARVAGADALLFALPAWLEDPRWHGKDLEDRRLRVQLTLPLVRFVTRLPMFDGPGGGGCAVWDVEYAVGRARAEIRAARNLVAEALRARRAPAADLAG